LKFDLKNLSSDIVILAICLFCALEGSLAHCFYSNWDLKLFGFAVSKYLIDGSSKVVAAPAKHQLANGLVESHWKVMVHMACACLIEKQMPRSFWFYAITHAARLMNTMPQVSILVVLHHPSYSFMGLVAISALGFHFST
jgi:hypothetical protein